METTTTFSSVGSMTAFKVVLPLLIYGIVLFPNVDNFMSVNDICIFLIRNPVPTLLVDTYYSIHHITKKNEGTIMCCEPLLYKWFILHFPQSNLFRITISV